MPFCSASFSRCARRICGQILVGANEGFSLVDNRPANSQANSSLAKQDLSATLLNRETLFNQTDWHFRNSSAISEYPIYPFRNPIRDGIAFRRRRKAD